MRGLEERRWRREGGQTNKYEDCHPEIRDGGQPFSAPPHRRYWSEDEGSGSQNDDLTHSLSLVFLQQGRVPGAMPPWPCGTRGLGRREILANRLQKAATKTPENSSQFAVWSLNRVIIF